MRLLNNGVELNLAESQLEKMDKDMVPFLSSCILLKSVVDLTASSDLLLKSVIDLTVSSDLDLQEKALTAIKNVLQLRTTEAAVVLKEACGLDVALERTKKQLKGLISMGEEDQKDYATDLESLRSQVEVMFHSKLGNNPLNAPEL